MLFHKKATFLAVTNNCRALTWSSGPDHKEIINITFTRWGQAELLSPLSHRWWSEILTHQSHYVQGANVELGINATVTLTLLTLYVSAMAELLCQPPQCIFPWLRLLGVASYELVWSVLLIERTNSHHQCFRHIFRSCLAKIKMVDVQTLTSDYVL